MGVRILVFLKFKKNKNNIYLRNFRNAEKLITVNAEIEI